MVLLFRVHHTKDEMFDCSVSFIIAGYNEVNNVLDTVNETYDVLKDYFKDFEIILIDDGSKDNSKQIAEKFANDYPNKIIYLEKENGGLSSARNYGLKYAKGDYISFVDSDDYVSKNYGKSYQFKFWKFCFKRNVGGKQRLHSV